MRKIPKKIHQIYTRGLQALPAEILASIAQLQERNPHWQYHFYDDERINNYIDTHYGQTMLDLYQRIDPRYGAARADLFRYLLMYKEGGVYLDIKSACNTPLDAVIPEHCEILLCNWDNHPQGCDGDMGRHPELGFLKNGEYQQWNIIVAPESPYLRSVIDEVVSRLNNYTPWRYGVGMRGVLHTTGPVPFSLGIEKVEKCAGFCHEENHRNIDLVYRNVTFQVMKEMNHCHYSRLKESVVLLKGMDKALFVLWRYSLFPLWRLRKNTINESRKVYHKIKAICLS